MHGGITLADVEYIVLPYKPDAALEALMREKNMEWKVYGHGEPSEREENIMEGMFSKGHSDAFRVENEGDYVRTLALFYRPDQRRDKGRFADEGRGRRPGMKRTVARRTSLRRLM